MSQKVQLLIIDPQNDFMDRIDPALPQPTLPVPGASDDMDRLAAMIKRIGHKINDVHVTLDSHHVVDVGHAAMWLDVNGRPPAPFTIISAADLRAGIWTPRNAQNKPGVLGGETIRQYFIRYAEALEAGGKYQLTVWPTHCLIGSPGHAVYAPLMHELNAWAERKFITIDFVTKGTNPWTEHYGGLMAEVPMANDPASGLNTTLLQMLGDADIILFAGEAASHCFKGTVQQVVDNVSPELVRKFYLLTDCTSPIPKVGNGPDFPAITAQWFKDMEAAGATLITSTEFLA